MEELLVAVPLRCSYQGSSEMGVFTLAPTKKRFKKSYIQELSITVKTWEGKLENLLLMQVFHGNV